MAVLEYERYKNDVFYNYLNSISTIPEKRQIVESSPTLNNLLAPYMDPCFQVGSFQFDITSLIDSLKNGDLGLEKQETSDHFVLFCKNMNTLGVSSLGIPKELVPILNTFNGEQPLQEIEKDLIRSGNEVDSEDLDSIVTALHRAGVLIGLGKVNL